MIHEIGIGIEARMRNTFDPDNDFDSVRPPLLIQNDLQEPGLSRNGDRHGEKVFRYGAPWPILRQEHYLIDKSKLNLGSVPYGTNAWGGKVSDAG